MVILKLEKNCFKIYIIFIFNNKKNKRYRLVKNKSYQQRNINYRNQIEILELKFRVGEFFIYVFCYSLEITYEMIKNIIKG